MAHLIALTGSPKIGKTTVAKLLRRLGWSVVSTSSLLRKLAAEGAYGRTVPTNDELFEFGNELDQEDIYWIFGERLAPYDRVVIDAVRSEAQADLVRHHGGIVVCIGEDHYKVTEPGDLHVPRWKPERIVSHVLQNLVVYDGETTHGQVTGIVGAQWGSEGKGKVCSWLVATKALENKRYAAFARSCGPNAGHRIECPNGEYAVFRHLPSATPWASPGTDLLIGPGAVVDAAVLAKELPYVPAGCTVTIDPSVALVDEHGRQLERDYTLSSIGSTLTGTGGAMALRVLRVADTFGKIGGVPDLPGVKVAPVGSLLRNLLRSGRDILIEATQGIGLSLIGGGYPHTTSRETGPAGLLADLGLGVAWDVEWWLVARTHPIRVAGPSGPMENETTWEEVARTSGIPAETLRSRETTTVTKRLRRVAKWAPGYLTEVASLFGKKPRIFLSFGDYYQNKPEEVGGIRDECLMIDENAIVGYGPGALDAAQLKLWSAGVPA